MTKEEELRLIRRVLDGDTDAYEPLVTENQTRAYHLAFRLMQNEEDAADAVQEAFLKAYTSLSGFRGESRFSVWLYRLVNNVCIDMLRRRKGELTVPLQTENEEGEERESLIPDIADGPERLAERAEDRQAVRDALARLPEDCREILMMREIGGLSYEELAEALALEIGTVKSRLNRARKKLCALLLESGNFSPPEPSNRRKGV